MAVPARERKRWQRQLNEAANGFVLGPVAPTVRRAVAPWYRRLLTWVAAHRAVTALTLCAVLLCCVAAFVAWRIFLGDPPACPVGLTRFEGACVDCLQHTDCGGTGVCDPASRQCVDCLESAHCRLQGWSGSGPLPPLRATTCTSSKTCSVACTSSAECAEYSAATPHCSGAGSCVACTASSQCAATAGQPAPVCVAGACIQCSTTGASGAPDCAAGYTCHQGACVKGCATAADCGRSAPACVAGACTRCDVVTNAGCNVAAPVCAATAPGETQCVECRTSSECSGGDVCLSHSCRPAAPDPTIASVTLGVATAPGQLLTGVWAATGSESDGSVVVASRTVADASTIHSSVWRLVQNPDDAAKFAVVCSHPTTSDPYVLAAYSSVETGATFKLQPATMATLPFAASLYLVAAPTGSAAAAASSVATGAALTGAAPTSAPTTMLPSGTQTLAISLPGPGNATVFVDVAAAGRASSHVVQKPAAATVFQATFPGPVGRPQVAELQLTNGAGAAATAAVTGAGGSGAVSAGVTTFWVKWETASTFSLATLTAGHEWQWLVPADTDDATADDDAEAWPGLNVTTVATPPSSGAWEWVTVTGSGMYAGMPPGETGVKLRAAATGAKSATLYAQTWASNATELPSFVTITPSADPTKPLLSIEESAASWTVAVAASTESTVSRLYWFPSTIGGAGRLAWWTGGQWIPLTRSNGSAAAGTGVPVAALMKTPLLAVYDGVTGGAATLLSGSGGSDGSSASASTAIIVRLAGVNGIDGGLQANLAWSTGAAASNDLWRVLYEI